jgi:hypothetical protein
MSNKFVILTTHHRHKPSEFTCAAYCERYAEKKKISTSIIKTSCINVTHQRYYFIQRKRQRQEAHYL